jgi:hypothetical protein
VHIGCELSTALGIRIRNSDLKSVLAAKFCQQPQIRERMILSDQQRSDRTRQNAATSRQCDSEFCLHF